MLLRLLTTVANEALQSPWIKIVLHRLSCGGENQMPDLRVDEWTTSLHGYEPHRVSHQYGASTSN
eukprot:scaffold554376_cov94-Attheya_sp.AAC.1